MSWDDDFSCDDPLPGDEDDSWRPPSRLGKASVALGLVACGTMMLFLRAYLGRAGLGFLGGLGMIVAFAAAATGIGLGVAGLRQRGFRRGWPILGLLVNGGVLVVMMILASQVRR